eukprot:TRINITY_DN40341_c0_g1_i1.p1 TRINITY_DN40341_c0_g1~~TRINITY_DN40341_c0_g1_i1.p1  ORF type:complete len:514 (-),score=48.47 TRINITY_DN40341_c0_g1_i1:10-1551(-)
MTTVAEKWKRRRKSSSRLNINVCLSFFFVLIVFSIAYYFLRPKSFAPVSATLQDVKKTTTAKEFSAQCNSAAEAGLPKGEKYMWYAPHSGFNNQIGELKNALLIAGILNRTLIIPPVLDHHAIALGSCPKFRVRNASEIRTAVWDHITQLIQERRYVSIADIIDLSAITSSSLVKIIDFRTFVSLWCHFDIGLSCSGELCHNLASRNGKSNSSGNCRGLITAVRPDLPSDCVYSVKEDCRTAVWTFRKEDDNELDKFQPDDNLRKKKKINYVRRRRNVEKALGPGSVADRATILLFGSLFSAPYKGSQLLIDVDRSVKDERLVRILQAIDFLPFTPEIINAAKKYAKENIKKPFLCAQLRLLDGQFKNHWNGTFSVLKNRLNNLQMKLDGRSDVIDLFIMTDLPETNWTGTYVGDLVADSAHYKIHVLKQNDLFLRETAKYLMSKEYGFRSGYVPQFLKQVETRRGLSSNIIPDVQLYIEETICSCATLGFVGTAGSTISDNIENMRKNKVCS